MNDRSSVDRDPEALSPDDHTVEALAAIEPGLGPEDITAEQVSLSRRLRDPRTIISIVVPLLLVVLIAVFAGGINFEQLGRFVLAADPLLLGAAFAVYYLGFPLRGYRWAILLRATGVSIRVRDSTEIVFISWLVNCLVPAKLGDIYRAYLLRLNYLVSLSRTFGTVFIERIFDLFAIVLLGLAAGFVSFREGLPPEIALIFGLGVAVILLLAVGLLVVRNFGRRLVVRLPLSHRVVEFYDRFEEGVFSIRRGQVPLLALITAFIWATEATRLFLVVQALGFGDIHLGMSGAFFVALVASLLTAIPFTPAGLGVVESAVVTILVLVYGVPVTEATAIALVDRAISVLSIIVLGGIAYILSPKTKSRSRPEPPGGHAPAEAV
ncbi:MAG: flippase-like domain-containing protein [Chloroflexi bacterium]|nr:flippase-like domain-containing protein [Chloroflexota bacterium]